MYGIYANIGGILMVNYVTIYIAYMDPMGDGQTRNQLMAAQGSRTSPSA